MGLTRGTINRMHQGQVPSTETIMALMRYENMRPDWFLKDEGTPYSIIRARSDSECAELLEELLGEEEWRVYLVTDGVNIAYVLTQPGQYQVKDRWVDYTIMEVITGPCGNEAVQAIYRRAFHPERTPLVHQLVETDRATMHDLVAGKMGTYAIALADHALLRKAQPITAESLVVMVSAIAGDTSDLRNTIVHGDVAEQHGDYTTDEQELVALYRAQPEYKRHAMLALLSDRPGEHRAEANNNLEHRPQAKP